MDTFSSRKECCLDLQVGVAPSNLPESLLINKFIAENELKNKSRIKSHKSTGHVMSKNCCCCLFFVFVFSRRRFFNFFHVSFCRHGGLKVGDKILAINDRVSKIITTLVIIIIF